MEQADSGKRLLSLLKEEADSLVREGRASVHETTVREFYNVSHAGADEVLYAVRPARAGAFPVGILPGSQGWYVLPGDGPSLEFWEGTARDFEETRSLLRAVFAGQYRYLYEQRFIQPLIFRWRPPRATWVCRGFSGADERVAGEHWNAPPPTGGPLQVQALPY